MRWGHEIEQITVITFPSTIPIPKRPRGTGLKAKIILSTHTPSLQGKRSGKGNRSGTADLPKYFRNTEAPLMGEIELEAATEGAPW